MAKIILMLSELLGIHMEDLLVKKNAMLFTYDIEQCNMKATQRRILLYCKKMYQLVA